MSMPFRSPIAWAELTRNNNTAEPAEMTVFGAGFATKAGQTSVLLFLSRLWLLNFLNVEIIRVSVELEERSLLLA